MSALIVEVCTLDALQRHPNADALDLAVIKGWQCVIYRGGFSLEAIKAASTGATTTGGADHIREGVVVRPVTERTDPKIGRVILKYLNDEYLLKKEEGSVTDSTDR